MESVESERESEQQMALLDGRPLPGDNFRDDPSLWDETLDLTPYINMSAFKVGAGCYLQVGRVGPDSGSSELIRV